MFLGVRSERVVRVRVGWVGIKILSNKPTFRPWLSGKMACIVTYAGFRSYVAGGRAGRKGSRSQASIKVGYTAVGNEYAATNICALNYSRSSASCASKIVLRLHP